MSTIIFCAQLISCSLTGMVQDVRLREEDRVGAGSDKIRKVKRGKKLMVHVPSQMIELEDLRQRISKELFGGVNVMM